MGQGSSQPEREAQESSGRVGGRLNRRASVLRRSIHILSSGDEGQQDGLLGGRQNEGRRTPRLRTRPGSVHRLSQLIHLDASSESVEDVSRNQTAPRGPGVLQRTRSTFREMLGRTEGGRSVRSRTISRPTPGFLQRRSAYVRTGMNSAGDDYYPPRLPSIDLSSTFDNDTFTPSSPADRELSIPRSSSSNRRPNHRFNPLRSDRPFRHLASLRRRRPSPPEIRRIGAPEDQAALLSRLLSAAAAATAATLMGDDHYALSEARSLPGGAGMGDVGGSGEDGSFDGFLRSLQNGRIASALRGGSDVESDATGSSQGPLNFFRMFRFGASAASQVGQEPRAASQNSEDTNNNTEGRMVPIIIVGIRSISPSSGGSTSASAADDLPPFINALGSFPSPLPAHALGTNGQDSIDSILRPPQNGTSFSRRRRASMGTFGMGSRRINDRMDDQRDHRSPDRRRDRPWSVASSSSALEPRPPPATPASPSPELSRISSRNSTPNQSRPASLIAPSIRELTGDSRRNSALNRTTTAPLSSHTEEETMSLHSTHSSTNLLSTPSQEPDLFRNFPPPTHRRSDTSPNIHYPRFASGHPRRNGMVEPIESSSEALPPPLSRASTSAGTDGSTRPSSTTERGNSSGGGNDSRSWIIYVLGGSYPENHPILTTPSLFTENPTYEDMMLLSALLGPAKAPVATEEDVESAGGVYTIILTHQDQDQDQAEEGIQGDDSESPLSLPEQMRERMSDDAAKTATLVAQALEDPEERHPLEPGQRCLVCLCDFEPEEIARRLAKCRHLFHKECIDQVSPTPKYPSKFEQKNVN